MVYNYDPYGGQTPEQQLTAGSFTKDLLTYPFRPSSYLTMMSVNPTMWNSNKGINVPFKRLIKDIDIRSPSVYKRYLKIYGKEGAKKLRGSAAGFARRSAIGLYTLGLSESERIGGNFLGRDYSRRIKAVERSAYRKSLKLSNMSTILNDMSRRGFEDKEYLQTYMKEKVSFLKSQEKIKNLKVKNRLQGLSKWGLRGAKTASYVGLAMLAWDITAAVVKPAAQLGMNVLNNVAMEYQQRFMPEMGGQLQLSYLSQGAVTERQRAISAISKAYINGRSAFGSEGSLMHQ